MHYLEERRLKKNKKASEEKKKDLMTFGEHLGRFMNAHPHKQQKNSSPQPSHAWSSTIKGCCEALVLRKHHPWERGHFKLPLFIIWEQIYKDTNFTSSYIYIIMYCFWLKSTSLLRSHMASTRTWKGMESVNLKSLSWYLLVLQLALLVNII